MLTAGGLSAGGLYYALRKLGLAAVPRPTRAETIEPSRARERIGA